MLLRLNQIETSLVEEVNFGEMAEYGISPNEVCLMPSRENPGELMRLEELIGRPLGHVFSQLVLRYDFSTLQLAGVFFGSHQTYVENLTVQNIHHDGFPWWGNGERPREYLEVGGTAGHIILLNLELGEVFALSRNTNPVVEKIAANFELFLRALGTARLVKVEDQIEFESQIGSDPRTSFWREIVNAGTFRR